MNVYEAMRVVRNEFVPHTIDAHLAMDEIGDVTDAYNALAPDWANAPEWAQWYAIDGQAWHNGESTACFYDEEPFYIGDEWRHEGEFEEAKDVLIPVGIDWRLCKWQRPEVTK